VLPQFTFTHSWRFSFENPLASDKWSFTTPPAPHQPPSRGLAGPRLTPSQILLSHQPSIASQYYAAAALPPYHSPAACLALGNVLLRGSSLAPNEIQADTNAQDKGEGKASSIKPSPISPVMVPRRSSEDSAIRSSPSNHPPYKAYRIFRVRLEVE
jgi:hypothetical protein